MRSFRPWCAILLLGCRSTIPSCTAPERARNAPSASASGAVSTPPPAPDDAGRALEVAAWAELVRCERWDDAAAAVEALPEVRRNEPALRLLRARLAMIRGEFPDAVSVLVGLERELAFITADIERWRAEAELAIGPFAEAAQYWERQGGAKALAKAALAQDRAGHAAEARALADRAIAAGGLGAEEPPMRALRIKLAEASGQTSTASDDARWICLRAPSSQEAAAAEQALGRLDPSRPLTGPERLARVEKLSDAGRTVEALAELGRAAAAPTPPASDEIDWARAFVLYKSRSDYDKAAALFDRLARRGGSRQAEALFYGARARSRADHDDDAVRGYVNVARKFPASQWADDATYLSARLMLLHGRWTDAAARYADYLKRYPAGRQHDAAAYERAVALLAGGGANKARAELSALATAAVSPPEAARLRELEALAALRAGDREHATKLWSDVIATQPLSWAALAARARLAQLGIGVVRLIAPPEDKPAQPLSYALPAGADLYHRLGLDGDAEAYLRAHEREAVVGLGGRDRETLCAMYDEIGRATRRYRIALESVPASVLSRAPSPAATWTWNCLYPRPYASIVSMLEDRDALPKGLLYAVMRQESAYDPDAVSPARAVGLLQLMPDTARRIAAEHETPYDEKLLKSPAVNLDLGARYLAKMLRTFDGSLPLTVAAYNAGPRAVGKWIERMPGVPLDVWASLIPYEETRAYVVRVMSNLARYAFLAGGEAAVPEIDLSPPHMAKLETSAF